jgi:hypothetical protein
MEICLFPFLLILSASVTVSFRLLKPWCITANCNPSVVLSHPKLSKRFKKERWCALKRLDSFDLRNCVSVVQQEINEIVAEDLSVSDFLNIDRSDCSKPDFVQILARLQAKRSKNIPLYAFCCDMLKPLCKLDSLSYQVENSRDQVNPRLVVDYCELFYNFLRSICENQTFNRLLSSLALELTKCWQCLIRNHKIDHYDSYAALSYSIRKLPEAISLIPASAISSDSRQNLRLAVQTTIEEWKKKETHCFTFFKTSCLSSSVNPSLSPLNDIIDVHYNRLLQAQPKFIEQSSRIMCDLELILTDGFAQDGVIPKLTLFGSRISGLSTAESDLDVSLQFLDARTNQPVKILIDRLRSRRSTKVNEDVIGVGVWRSSEILRYLRKLFQSSREFQCDSLILAARVPIIKLKHLSTGVEVVLLVCFYFLRLFLGFTFFELFFLCFLG